MPSINADILCPLCGVTPEGGASQLAADWSLDEDVQSILPELRELCKPMVFDDAELQEIVQDGFRASTRNYRLLGPGYAYYTSKGTVVAVGYWVNVEGKTSPLGCFEVFYRDRPNAHDYSLDPDWRTQPVLIPDGREVDVLRLRTQSFGMFMFIVTVNQLGEEKEVESGIHCHPTETPCVFLCEHCYFYLQAWIDWDGLPDRRTAFPNDTEPLSFAGELYEVINSRTEYLGTLSSCARSAALTLHPRRIQWNPS